MEWIRRPAAGILAICCALLLAACHSGQSGSTQAASQESAGAGQTNAATGQSNAGPAPAPTEAAPPEPEAVTIPAGTMINVRLDDSLSSARNRGGDSFEATLVEPILVNGMVAAPEGARVKGRVVVAAASGHLETPAELSVTLTALELGGQVYNVRTSNYTRRGQSHTKHDAKWIGGLAGGGALLGALIGHGKGAAIGAGVGGGAGTAGAYATGKKDIYLPSETRMRFVLKGPVTVNIAG